MFGAGNEPTVEEFEAMFPADYYEYDEGTLMSIPVNEVVEQGKNLCPVGNVSGTHTTDVFPVSVHGGKLFVSFDVFTDTSDGACYIGVEYYDANKKTIGRNGYAKNVGNSLSNVQTIFNGANAKPDGSSLEMNSVAYIRIMFDIHKNTATKITFENIMVSTTESKFIPFRKQNIVIPQAILDLDGYGDGVSDEVYNCIDWENKKYHKRVGKVDLGSLDWTRTNYWGNYLFYCAVDGKNPGNNYIFSKYNKVSSVSECNETNNGMSSNPIANYVYIRDDDYTTKEDFKAAMQGTILYYELAEEEIIDISNIIDNTFQEPIEVEAGGTLTFRNSNGDGYCVPVPNEEEYVVSLAEVSE